MKPFFYMTELLHTWEWALKTETNGRLVIHSRAEIFLIFGQPWFSHCMIFFINTNALSSIEVGWRFSKKLWEESNQAMKWGVFWVLDPLTGNKTRQRQQEHPLPVAPLHISATTVLDLVLVYCFWSRLKCPSKRLF